jgi:hypothetical protein
VEPAGKAPARAETNAAEQPPRAFEDQIRRILEEQQRNNTSSQQPKPPAPPAGQPPKSPQSSLSSYQTQSYSQRAAEADADGDTVSSPPAVATEADPAPQHVPMPEKRSPTGKRPGPAAPQSSFWKLFQ